MMTREGTPRGSLHSAGRLHPDPVCSAELSDAQHIGAYAERPTSISKSLQATASPRQVSSPAHRNTVNGEAG